MTRQGAPDLGARVETACPDFSEVPDIIRGTRALTMVALHADRLPKWRESMQKELVLDTERGLGLTTRDIARSEVLRSVLWQRVQTFMATRDLLVLPTVAASPFPVEQAYLTEINGRPLDHYFQWFFLTYGITLTGLPAISVPCGFTRDGLPVGLQIVAAAAGGRSPPGGRRVRGRGSLGSCSRRWSRHSRQARHDSAGRPETPLGRTTGLGVRSVQASARGRGPEGGRLCPPGSGRSIYCRKKLAGAQRT